MTGKQEIPLFRNFRFLLFLAILAILVFFYREPLAYVVHAVVHRRGSSHGIFVPFLSVYFLWLKLDKIKGLRFSSSLWSAGCMFMAGLLFSFFGGNGNLAFPFSFISFLCLVSGSILALLGWKMFKEIMFPLFFLITMIPIPQDMYNRLAEWLRFINTSGSVTVSRAFGVPIFRDGYDIYLPHAHLNVDYGCSGIRYMLSFVTFSFVYGYLFKSEYVSRILTVAISILLALVAGITRLASVFMTAHYISPFWAEKTPHIVLSWVVFMLFLFGAVGIDRIWVRLKLSRGARSGVPDKW